MTEDESSYLTIAELAERLGRSPSAIREWRRAYRELIPAIVGQDGYHRYSLAVFEQVAALHSRRLPAAEVRAELERRRGSDDLEAPVPPAGDFEARGLELLEQIAADVRRIADRLDDRNSSGNPIPQ